MKKRLVSAKALTLLQAMIDESLDRKRLKKEWLDHACSKDVDLTTDHDWIVLAAAWLLRKDLER